MASRKRKPPLQVGLSVTFAAVLGSLLRLHRKRLGHNQKVIADAVGVSCSAWSRTENGQCAITVIDLRKAAAALGLDTVEFLRSAEELFKRLPSVASVTLLETQPEDDSWLLSGRALDDLLAKLL